MKIVGLSRSRTDREWRDAFRSEVHNPVLVLHSPFHLNKTIVQHHERGLRRT